MSSHAAHLNQLSKLMRSVSTYRLLAQHTAADRLGLSMTELKCLDAARNIPDLTPGRMARIVGLSSSAATAAIDRLERRRLVQRARDVVDRRRVFVTSTGLHESETAELFAPLASATDDILQNYSDAELTLVNEVLAQISESCERLVAEWTAQPDDSRASDTLRPHDV